MFEDITSNLVAGLVFSVITFGLTRARYRYVMSKNNGHLHELHRRTENLKVIVPSKFHDESGVSWLTTVDGLAYGWLLKAWTPIEKRKIECVSAASRPQVGGSDILTIILGRIDSNETLDRFVAAFLPSTQLVSSSSVPRGCVLTHMGRSYESTFGNAGHMSDYAFLVYDADQQIVACFGTSPFGSAGAVSMFVEADEKSGANKVADLLRRGESFMAVGEVSIPSEMEWRFIKVVDVFTGVGCQHRVGPSRSGE